MSDAGFTAPPPPPPPSAGGGGPLQPRELGDILSTAFEVYKANAAKLILIVAIVVVPLALIGALIRDFAFGITYHTEVIAGQTVRIPDVVISRGYFGSSFLATLLPVIAFVMSYVLQAAVARAGAQAVVGDQVDAEASYRYGFRRFGSVLWISILVGLIVLGGLILLVIPGIIFAVFLAVSIPALVIENRRGTDALGRSWNLVKGSWWHVFGTVIVAFLITGIIAGIISAIGGSFWVTSWIFSSIAQILVAPYVALVMVILYLDLRARQEAMTADTLRSEIAAAGS
jgi:hypothetical protein